MIPNQHLADKIAGKVKDTDPKTDAKPRHTEPVTIMDAEEQKKENRLVGWFKRTFYTY